MVGCCTFGIVASITGGLPCGPGSGVTPVGSWLAAGAISFDARIIPESGASVYGIYDYFKIFLCNPYNVELQPVNLGPVEAAGGGY